MTSDEALFRTVMKVTQERWLESTGRAEQDPVVAPSYVYADKGYRHLRMLVDDVREPATT